MKVENLPFLHYLVRGSATNPGELFSPLETEHSAPGGSFFVPIRGDGKFHPAYCFHFSLYLGQGKFVTEGEAPALYDGVAMSVTIGRKDHLLLTFDFPGSKSRESRLRLPYVPWSHDEVYVPLFQRVPRRATGSYKGRFNHQDFASQFVEVEPTDHRVLDDILERFSISLIGCDPHTQYQSTDLSVRREPVPVLEH